MVTGVKVGDLMTRNFVYTTPDTNLKKCAELMVKKKVGSLIIAEKGELRGILTEKDIIYALVKKSKKDLAKISAEDLMKRKVVTIKPNADVNEALERIKREKVRRLPVIENGKIIGMLTLNDILKIDPRLFEMISENVQIREETEKLKRNTLLRGERKKDLCEECGADALLIDADGQWICEVCFNAR